MSDNNDEYLKWSLPDLDNDKLDKNIDNTETSLFGKPASWYQDAKSVPEVKEEEPKPLTIDDIEEIRQSAYDDGFKEGLEAGTAQGLQEGVEQGLAKGLEDGTAQGLETGTAEGLALGKVQIDAQIKQWDTLLTRLHTPLELLDENVEYQLVTLAQHLAEQICRVQLKTDPQIILQALKQAVEALPLSEQTLKILLHPDDLLFVQQAYSVEVCKERGWSLSGEPALARGDCQIHTKTSSIDYAFNTRVDQVLKHFLQQNHEHIPNKNDDSSLLNNTPLPDQENIDNESGAQSEASDIADTSSTSSTIAPNDPAHNTSAGNLKDE